MAGIGHNSGRVDEPGKGWRTHAWKKARKSLLPTLPIEVVRLRVRRAAELGLPYRIKSGVLNRGEKLPGLHDAFPAPPFNAKWSEMRERVKDIVSSHNKPADRFLIVGDTAFEREWAEAALAAGYLSADQFFSDIPFGTT